MITPLIGIGILLGGQGQPPIAQQKAAVSGALKRLSPSTRSALIDSAQTDENGMVGFNKKNGFDSVADQRGVATALTMAIAGDDKEKVKKTFADVQKTFNLERSDGTYPIAQGAATGTGMGAQVGDAMSWLSEAVPALVRLEAYDASYKPQINALRDKVARSGEFILPRRNLLLKRSSRGTNWLCRDAKCLIYMGSFLDDQKYTAAGNEFLNKVFTVQTDDGIYPEEGGGDTNYQSVSLRQLCEIYLLDPRPATKSSIKKGADWYLAHFLPDGRIDVRASTRTGEGHLTSRGYAKNGNQALPVSMTLALLASVLPDSKASTTLDNFTKVAFREDGHPKKSTEYIIQDEDK